MSHLTLSTFGTLRVVQDGVPITSFATDKARALLVYLAVEAARNTGALPSRAEAIALALEDAGMPPLALPLQPPADHTPAATAPDLPDRAQLSATPAP